MAAQLLLLARQATLPVVADGELLDRFTRTRENEAFSELVRRHGPVVYRICRKLVGPTAADDAFQATFLLLATRTAAACAAGSVGSWLVGVAGRVARQMRRAALRRTHHETTAANHNPIAEADPTLDLLDQFRILDEELARLPDRLRAPVTSCLLQGHTQEQAATESGQTTRTVRRRLDEARRLLRVRLLRRGVTPTVAAGLVAGLGSVSMAVPTGLVTRTVAVVFDFLTGGEVASPPVVLAKGVATTMLARKMIPLMMAVAVGLTTLGLVLGNDGGPIQPPVDSKAASPDRLPNPPTTGVPTLVGPTQEKPKSNPPEKQITPPVKPDEPQVLIRVLCIRVPAGFCEECGLTLDESTSKTGGKSSLVMTGLNGREVKMLNALIRAKKFSGEVDVLTRPQLVVADGQTGYFQVGGQAPVVTGFDATTKDGKTVNVPKVTYVDYGISLRVTPKINKDSGFITLRAEPQVTELAPELVEIPVTPPGSSEDAAKPRKTLNVTSPSVSINTNSLQTTFVVPDGGTMVFGGPEGAAKAGAKKTELLLVLTAHVVRAQP